MKKKNKEKLREKIYDLVYDSLSMERDGVCMHEDRCTISCYGIEGQSELYDKLVSLLEGCGVPLDKEV